MLALAKSPLTRLGRGSADAGMTGMMNAINRVQAVIEFGLDGKILHANENFLKTLGYSLEEIKGNHHSMFVDAAYRQSPDYRLFWEKLGRGEYDAGQYKRIGKGGRVVWIQASYNPVLDQNGKPFKVVKFATDITEQKLRNADYEGQIAAISKAQAVIEFTLDGKVIGANNNFLKVLGYSLGEIKGQHHAMFVEAGYRQSPEYRLFWEKLGHGEYEAGQYKRVGKGGTEVWIQASYNPIMDADGKPFKVVKYATDITASVKASQVLQQAVQQVQVVVEAAKDNVLTERVPLDGKSGEIGALCAGVNGLLDTMMAVVVKIRASAHEISSASAEISTSTTDLSQRTEEQAASLEETSASMEQMSATVKKNADNAQQANQSAGATRDVADRGGQVVAKAVEAMARIEESSRKISDIAAASAEQATGIEQVNKALTQMDEVTQQNSALVEENAATAKTLEQQAKAMSDEVSVFRVEGIEAELPRVMQRSPGAVVRPGPGRPRQSARSPMADRLGGCTPRLPRRCAVMPTGRNSRGSRNVACRIVEMARQWHSLMSRFPSSRPSASLTLPTRISGPW